MSEYVGLVKGKVHDKREMSEYYCGGCGYPVTDHDSYCRECGGMLHEGLDKSRWFELFGTPERPARTICRQLKHFNICICDGCPVKPPNKECDSEYDALLVWMVSEVRDD